MARPFPLEVARGHAHRLEERAADVLRAQAERVRAAEAKLRELEQYRAEYREQMRQLQLEGAPAGRFRDFEAFLARIAEAIEQQAREAERIRAGWEQARSAWQEKHSRSRAFDVLADEHAAEELVRSARQEQKNQDEFARRTAAKPGRGRGG